MKMKKARLNVECLEGRHLMATGVTATLSGGVLDVEGTNKDDQIFVMQNGNQITIADQYLNQLVKVNGKTTSVSTS